jgi:hypothetical protein
MYDWFHSVVSLIGRLVLHLLKLLVVRVVVISVLVALLNLELIQLEYVIRLLPIILDV